MKSILIRLDDKELEVKKLPIIKYAELFKEVKNIPHLFNGLEGKTNDAFFERLPEIITGALPDFIGLISVATELKKEEVEQLGLNEVVKVVIAIFEVNSFKEIFDQPQLKKVLAAMQQRNKKISTKQ
jgi:hypothetical protein